MSKAIIWFRNDLRISDNTALYNACLENEFLIPLYILNQINGAQKWWVYHSLKSLDKSLKANGLNLIIRSGDPKNIIKLIADEFKISNVYWNRRYDMKSIDQNIKLYLKENNINVKSFNGSLLKEPWTVKNTLCEPFKVFTPFSKAIKNIIDDYTPLHINKFPKKINIQSEDIEDFSLIKKWSSGFAYYFEPGEKNALKQFESFINKGLKNYKTDRDFVEKNSTSYLSPHIHFGEISVKKIYHNIEILAQENDSYYNFLNQIIWREFTYHTIFHYPNLSNSNLKNISFNWEDNEKYLKAWKNGQTGYPIIDAGMRELYETGYMHNRVRMIVGSFLTKNLMIHWKSGADWFMDTLLDGDEAINSFSWQWVAGTGFDAVPYFRIFNPYLQAEKFDSNCVYIKKWVKELKNIDSKIILNQPSEIKGYFKPIVNYKESRAKALKAYKNN